MSDSKVSDADRFYYKSLGADRACDLACVAAQEGDQYKLEAIMQNEHMQAAMWNFTDGFRYRADPFRFSERFMRRGHPLVYAALQGHILVVEDLINEYHACVEVSQPHPDYSLITPLFAAMLGKHTAVVKCLVTEHGANVNGTFHRFRPRLVRFHMLQYVLDTCYDDGLRILLRSGRLNLRLSTWTVRSYYMARTMMRVVPSPTLIAAATDAEPNVRRVIESFHERSKLTVLLVADPRIAVSSGPAPPNPPVLRSFLFNRLFDRNVIGIIADFMAAPL